MSEIEQIAPIVTRKLRQEVLYPRQPLHSVILEEDDLGIHFGLYDDNKLIAVVSLFITGLEAQFRKLAIDARYQRNGHGSKLLRHLMAYVHAEGVEKIWCNARVSAVPFYQKYGFSLSGPSFMQNGIEYIKMEKQTVEIKS